MIEGHALEDFSAIYKYLAINDDPPARDQGVFDFREGNGFTKLTLLSPRK
jgi:hypothetical protein